MDKHIKEEPRVVAMRVWWVSVLLVPLVTFSGCMECQPEKITLDIQLHIADSEFRSLPMLQSGSATVGDQTLPDSHGFFTFEPRIAQKNITRVTATGLDVQILVGGEPLPIKIVHTTGLGSNDLILPLEGTLREDRPVTIWWRIASGDLDIPTGTAYTIVLEADWLMFGCKWRGSGIGHGAASDVFLPPSEASAFAPRSVPTLTRSDAGTTMEGTFALVAGKETQIRSATGYILDAGSGASAVFNDMIVDVERGGNGTVVPGGRAQLEARSPVSLVERQGPYVIVIHIDHDHGDVDARDAFAFLIR